MLVFGQWLTQNGEAEMGKKRFRPEQIILKLREAEVDHESNRNINRFKRGNIANNDISLTCARKQ